MMEIFEKLKEYCVYGFVTRKGIGKLTGGFLPPSTQAQLDFKGIGIRHQRVGRRAVYNIDDVIEWLKNNTVLINFDE